jgi:hypothetical protein
MRIVYYLITTFLFTNSAFAICPINELENQEFKVVGFQCNGSQSSCEQKKDSITYVKIIKGNEWELKDLYWVKLDWGGIGFQVSQVDHVNHSCTKSQLSTGEVVYNFYHNVCKDGCYSNLMVKGNKAEFVSEYSYTGSKAVYSLERVK